MDLVVWKLLGVQVPLALLAKPMIIESKYMSVSQIQKELLPFQCFHEVAAAILDLVCWKLLGVLVPLASLYAKGHRVQMHVSITNTEGVIAILMIS